MKVLVTMREEDHINPFFIDIASNFPRDVQIKYSIHDFWLKNGNPNILHIQWPELLTLYKNPSDIELFLLENEIFPYWKKTSPIIVTRHNIQPHKGQTPGFEKLYHLTYSNANAVIHMGRFSLEDYQKRYPDFAKKQDHYIIPHVMYESFPKSVDQITAREHLKISQDSKVILVFGAIRTLEEMKFTIDTFKRLRTSKKIIIITRYRATPPSLKSDTLNYLQSKKIELYSKFSKKIVINQGVIPDEEVQFFLMSADIVFIPRINSLNSGNVPLGFAFGKVVAGPQVGNIEELLSETGNPTFPANSPKEAAKALEQGIELNYQGHGALNQQFGAKHWSGVTIANAHLEVYKKHTQSWA